MRDRVTGEHYLIEADMRPHSWFALSRFAGVDFSTAIQNFLEGNEYTLAQPMIPEQIEVRHFFRDIRRSVADRSFLEIARWCINSGGRWKYIPLHDTRLFVWTLESLARSYLYKVTPVRRLVQWFIHGAMKQRTT